MSFSKIQDLACQGKLPNSLLGFPHPICKSCQYGKAHRRSVAAADIAQPIDVGNLNPGDRISIDQIKSWTPGYINIFKGKPTSAKYHVASVYLDHASRYTFVKCHYSTGAHEAIEGKQLFERSALTHGTKVKAYHADNGIMSCHDYAECAHANQQAITFCGVNVHGQNGIAECYIHTLCDRTRTMLLHAMEHWPDVITLELWPFALKMVADIHNVTPGPSGLSPEEILTKQRARPDRLLDFHSFSCPVFVLDPSLQQGHKIPK
jgi:hypothetical protein